MLVLTRKEGEKIVINGNVTVMVVEIVGGKVRLGISAPDDVKIYREELLSDRPKKAPRREHIRPTSPTP